MKKEITEFMTSVQIEDFQSKYDEFAELVFTLFINGNTKESLINYITFLYHDDNSRDIEQEIADDFLCRIGGQCPPYRDLKWPEFYDL